jgi:hypothetical protein
MKTRARLHKRESGHAATRDRETGRPGTASFLDKRASASHQRQIIESVDNSVPAVTQAQRADRFFGATAQLAGAPEEELQMKSVEEEELLQGKAADNAGLGVSVESATDGLPATLRAGVEAASGMDLTDVRVHRNSAKPAQLHALAYTQGSEIHVGPGQERHIPHEAWHVVQQREGRVAPTIQSKGVAINDNADLEREADVMGARAAQAKLPELE